MKIFDPKLTGSIEFLNPIRGGMTGSVFGSSSYALTASYALNGGSGGGSSITASSNAPTSPTDNQLWYDADTGKTYIRYNDGTSTQWVLQSDPTIDVNTSLQTLQEVTDLGTTTTHAISITDTTNAIDSASGAFIVGGGAGFGLDVWARKFYGDGSSLTGVVATNIVETDTLQSVTTRGTNTSASLTITNTTNSTNTGVGALKVSGGLYVGLDIWAKGITSSLEGTSSWSNRSITASFVTGTIFTSNNLVLSSSFALTASYVANASSFPYSGSAQVTGSLGVTGSISVINGGFTGSISASNLQGTLLNSQLQNSSVTIGSTAISLGGTATTIGGITSLTVTNFTASIISASNHISGGQIISLTGFTGSISSSGLKGSILNTQLQNSSVTVGSTAISLGASSTTITGLVSVNSTSVTASIVSASQFSGSLFGTSSWATNAITAQTASSVGNLNQNFVVTGSVRLSGSIGVELLVLGDQEITGSLRVTGGITAQSITGSITASSLQGVILNSQLQNSSVTIGTTAISLGGSSTTIGGIVSLTSTNITASIISASAGLTGSLTASSLIGDIRLGTQTSGDYISTLTQGTGVTITSATGEGSNPTIAIGQAVGTTSNVQFNNITASIISASNHISGGQVIAVTGFTGSLSSSFLKGAILNAQLQNSSVTVGSTAISLGGSATTITGLTSVSSTSVTGSIISASQFSGSISSSYIVGDIILGTQTTGSYIGSIVQGTGVIVTNGSGEGVSTTIAIGQAVGTTSNVQFNQITASIVSSSAFSGSLFGTASYVTGSIFTGNNQVLSASFAITAAYALNAAGVGGGVTSFNTRTGAVTLQASDVSGLGAGIISSSAFTASWANNALTASYLNPLNQGNVIITGSVIISGSNAQLLLGGNVTASTEASLIIGLPPGGWGNGEGGQIILQAPNSGGWSSASMWDNYQNQTRLLVGNNTTSNAVVASFNMHTKQVQFPAYNSVSAFAGTAAANLAVDTSGNIITVSTSGGSVFPYTGNAQINGGLGVTGSISATSTIISTANGQAYFRGGDDAELWDINLSNHIGIYGQQDQGVASIKLGSGGGIISGRSGSIGINTTNPSNNTNFDVVGIANISGALWVTGSAIITGSVRVINGGFTGSLLATNGVISASSFTSPSQGTLRATINGQQTDVDLALQTGDDVTFNKVTATNGLTGSLTASSLIGDIRLGTQTSGDYVSTITQGTGVTVTGGTGEGSTPTIAIGQAVGTTSNVQFNNITASIVSASQFTGSLLGTASFSNRATTASFYEIVTGSAGTDFNITSSLSGSIINIPDASATARGLVTTGAQTIAGNKTFTGVFVAGGSSNLSANLVAAQGVSSISGPPSNITLLGNTSRLQVRVYTNNTTQGTLQDGDPYATHIIGGGAVAEASTGTHPLIAQLALKRLPIVDGAGSTTNYASLYVEGASTGSANPINNYALWVDSGSTRLDGDLIMSQSNIIVTGSVNASAGFTGSLLGTASYITGSIFTSTNPVLSASYALTASYVLGGSSQITIQDEGDPKGSVDTLNFVGSGVNATVAGGTATITVTGGAGASDFPYTGSAIISGSLSVTGSFSVSGSGYNILDDTQITGSLGITGSLRIRSTTGDSFVIFSSDGNKIFYATSSAASGLVRLGDLDNALNGVYLEVDSQNEIINANGTVSVNNGLRVGQNLTVGGPNSVITGSLTISGSQKITGSSRILADGTDAFEAFGNINNYFEIYAQNLSNGISASTDIVAYNDQGNKNQNYVDMGINSSGISSTYSFGRANDAYVYNTGGDLFIGNSTAFYQPTRTSQSLHLFANAPGTPDLTITGSRIGIQKSSSLNATLDVLGNVIISGALHITGSSAAELKVLGESQFTGSVAVTNGIIAQSVTASLFGTASYVTGSVFTSTNRALSASYSLTASFALNAGGGSGAGFPFEGEAVITGSILLSTGSAFFPILTASEALAAGDFVNIATGGVRKASNNDITKLAHGYVIEAYSATNPVKVFYDGINPAASGLSIGSRYFLGTSGGETLTPPTAAGSLSQEIGVAVSTTAILVNFKSAIVT